MLSVLRAQVQSLVGELRSHKPHGMTKTNKEKKKKKKTFLYSSGCLGLGERMGENGFGVLYGMMKIF